MFQNVSRIGIAGIARNDECYPRRLSIRSRKRRAFRDRRPGPL
jgi:hypothetical protein